MINNNYNNQAITISILLLFYNYSLFIYLAETPKRLTLANIVRSRRWHKTDRTLITNGLSIIGLVRILRTYRTGVAYCTELSSVRTDTLECKNGMWWITCKLTKGCVPESDDKSKSLYVMLATELKQSGKQPNFHCHKTFLMLMYKYIIIIIVYHNFLNIKLKVEQVVITTETYFCNFKV